jgi:hypothetical protein
MGGALPLLMAVTAGASDAEPGKSLRESVEVGRRTLVDCGYTVSVADTLPAVPHPEALDALADHGLIAVAPERAIRKDSVELQWLSLVKASALLAFQDTGRTLP